MAQQDQRGLGEAAKALEGLFAKCDEDGNHAFVVFSTCLVLMRHLSIDQPVALRQACAVELYRLADALAENNPSALAEEERRA